VKRAVIVLAGWLAAIAPVSGIAAPAAPGATTEAVTGQSNRDPAAITKAIEDARAALERASADRSSPGAAPEEILERDHLLGRIVESLFRQLDFVRMLPEAQRRALDQQAEADRWTAFPTPPPYSILFSDELRESLESARIDVQGAAIRKALLAEAAAKSEKDYKAADVLVRQSEERIGRESSAEGRARQTWLRDLARLRSRAAVEDLSEAQIQAALAEATESEKRALVGLLEKQLAVASQSVRFTQSDLDAVLLATDRQRQVLEDRQVALSASGNKIRQALDGAQRALAAARAEAPKPSESATERSTRLTDLEDWVGVRRLQSDNHDLGVETVREMLNLRSWERTSWQYRWLLVNSGDAAKVEDATAQLDQLLQRLDGWSGYLAQQIDLSAGRIGEYELRQKNILPPSEAERVTLSLAAYRERLELLSAARQAIEQVRRTWLVWRQQFQARGAARSPRAIGEEWGRTVVHAMTAVWNFELFTAEDSLDVDGRHVVAKRSVTVGKSAGMILALAAGYVFIGWLLRRVRHIAVNRLGRNPADTRTVLGWIHFILLSMLFVIALYMVNIPLTVFAFLGGALAIGVGFGTQVLLKNMISGIMLLLERPLRIGDLVEVGSVVGTVTNISIRSSTVRTSDGIEILVPNSVFIENNVTNWTYSSSKVRRFVTVGVDCGASPERVSQILLGVAKRHPGVLDDPAPRVLLEEFGAYSLDFKLQYWIDYAQGADGSLIASDLRIMIESALSEAGISIPFPQRMIHIKPAEDQQLQPLSKQTGGLEQS
jgi:small-conductance mechanosensitive channel